MQCDKSHESNPESCLVNRKRKQAVKLTGTSFGAKVRGCEDLDCNDCEDDTISMDDCADDCEDDCCKKDLALDCEDECCKESGDLCEKEEDSCQDDSCQDDCCQDQKDSGKDLCGEESCGGDSCEEEFCEGEFYEGDSCGEGSCCGKKDSCDSKSVDSCCQDPAKDAGSSKETNSCEDECCQADAAPVATLVCLASLASVATSTDSCCRESRSSLDLLENSCYSGDESSPLVVKCNTPCNSHLDRAMKEYEAIVKLGQCICSEMMKRAEKLYGVPRPVGWTSSVHRIHKQRARNTDCCEKRSRRGCSRERREKSDCERKNKNFGCHEKKSYSCHEKKSDSCGVTTSSRRKAVDSSGVRVRGRKSVDLEAGGGGELALFKVSGMTCTGCAKKVIKVLEGIDGISGIEVTFVTATVKFDHDPDIIKLQDATARLTKETGFKYSEIKRDEQTLDLTIEGTPNFAKIENLVENIEKVAKNTYRVWHNPHDIGARDILYGIPGASLAKLSSTDHVAKERRQYHSMLWKTIASAVFTVPVLVLAWGSVDISDTNSLIIQLVLATVIQGIAVPEFYVRALKSLVYSRVLEMDLLVVISVTAAYGYSVVAFALEESGIKLEQEAIFETSTLLITLVLFGRLFATMAKMKAVSAISMRQLQSYTSTIVDNGKLKEIDSRLLQYGDRFVVKAHSRIVTDGVVGEGEGTVDESMITGESTPILKTPNSLLIAGTMNGGSVLTAEVTRLPGDNSISDIAELVENALSQKPKIQDLADKIAGYFVPTVMGIAIVVFIIWIVINLEVRHRNAGGAVGSAITYGIAVMAISCPCALGLAVPMVLVVAGGVAAKKGVLIKSSAVLERGHKVTDIVLDKTGTLTDENMVVAKMEIFPGQYGFGPIKAIVKELTEKSDHPMSQAISAYLGSQQSVTLKDVENVPGSGIQAKWNKSNVKLGNPYWLRIDQDADFQRVSGDGFSYLCITIGGQLAGIFCLKATLRPEAVTVIEHFKAKGITCHIVSGDNATAVQYTADLVGIPYENIRYKYTPAEKLGYVSKLIENGKNVLFCGDGINDAAAVAHANVGVQIGNTADLTLAAADVVLSGGLEGIVQMLAISKKSFRIIMFNFAWAFVYNLVAILGTSGAFVDFRIPPAYAGVGEVVSVLPVILAAMSIAL